MHQARENLLRRELQHRVSNILQSITSMTFVLENTSSSEEVRKRFETLRERLGAYGAIEHSLREAETVEFPAQMLDTICQRLTETLVPGRIQCDIQMDRSIRLTAGQLQTLALIINELITNALKHAFTESTGRIRISLSRSRPGQAMLVCTDDGRPFPESFSLETETGSGLRIAKALAEELGGDFTILSRLQKQTLISFPLTNFA